MKKSEKSKEKASSEKMHEKKHRSSHSSNPAAEMFKDFVSSMKKPSIDREAIMNNHRKNLDAINDANKMAVEVIKTIAQLQSQYVRQTFEDINAMMREMSASKPSPHHQWESHAGKIKEVMTKAIDHSASIANVVLKSNHELHGKMQDRFNEHLDEMKEKSSKYKH
jgi:phasin family protein